MQLGKELYARLLTDSTAYVPGPVRLRDLWHRYSTECDAFLDNKAATKRDDGYKVEYLLAHFGPGFDVRVLSTRDVAEYQRRRRAGGIVRDSEPSLPVGQRCVHGELSLLRRMLRWACTVRTPGGGWWLDRNPLDGLRFEREKNPRRPVASIERFNTTRAVIQGLARDAASDGERLRWLRLELALVLAEATGRRRGAIVGLRWEDFDFAANKIHWRAEFDKKGKAWLIPVPDSLMQQVRQFQRAIGAAVGFVFPGVQEPSEHMPVELLTQWLMEAETKAKLPKLKGGLWHPYRRKWASERMHRPLKQLADAGGWSDPMTLVLCYQQTDDAMLLDVMSEPRKRSEGRVTLTA